MKRSKLEDLLNGNKNQENWWKYRVGENVNLLNKTKKQYYKK